MPIGYWVTTMQLPLQPQLQRLAAAAAVLMVLQKNLPAAVSGVQRANPIERAMVAAVAEARQAPRQTKAHLQLQCPATLKGRFRWQQLNCHAVQMRRWMNVKQCRC